MDGFTLLQNNPLVGLIDLDLLLVADNVLLVPIFLAVYMALKRASEPAMLVATALGLLAATLFIASNPAVEMLSLSNDFAAATAEGERVIALAAGQAMLATWEGSAFQTAYFLGSIAGIIIGIVMLRSRHFGKTIAAMGILGNAVALGYYVPAVGIYLSVFSVLFLEIWYILLGRQLLQMGSNSS
jgi:hypothetical protein